MRKGYSKKLCNPSSTISLSTPVFGFVTLTVWVNFGIVVKKFSTILNWLELSDSTKSVSADGITGMGVQISVGKSF